MPNAPARTIEIKAGSGVEHIPQLVELSRSVYGSHPDMTSEDYHRWLYLDGPCGPAIQVSAFAEGRMIGHYAIIPHPFHDRGGDLRAGLGVNAIVHPDAEGRGLFARLVAAADAKASAQGIELLYVVPGPQSEPWFTTVLRYVRDGELSIFVEPLRPAAMLRHGPARLRPLSAAGMMIDPLLRLRAGFLNRRRPPRDIAIVRVEHVGPEFDDLWMRIRGAAGRTTIRNAAYLRWRYLDCPTRRYQILAAMSRERIVGYVVSRSRTLQQFPGLRVGSIVDVISDDTPEGSAAVTALIAAACRSLRQEGNDAVIAQLRLPSRLAPSLQKNGLWRMPAGHSGTRPIAFKGKANASGGPFHFTGGDFDMG